MTLKIPTIVLCLIIFSTTADQVIARVHKNGYCMMYGQCGFDETSQKPIPCYYNGPSLPLTDERALQVLDELCPWMVNETGITKTCCDGVGLNTLLNNVQPAQQTLDRCPSCYRNFLNLLCSTTCSPNQSVFINVNKTNPVTVNKFVGNESIVSIDVYVEDGFAQGMYNACRDVNFPSTNTKVMALYCGQYGADHCSAQRWLDFIGAKSNGETPYQFNYYLNNSTFKPPAFAVPLNLTIHPCNEGVGNTSQPCSCQDCPKACPPIIPPPPVPTPCTVGCIDCFTFYTGISYLLFAILFTIFIIVIHLRSRKVSIDRVHENGATIFPAPVQKDIGCRDKYIGCRESIGEFIDRVLTGTFRALGTFVSHNPLPVIFVSVIVVVGLSCGIIMIQVLTDPVELWSPPESEARLDKDYFDDHFGPFYRTEQLIIQTTNLKPFIHEQYPYYTDIPFGPVFHKDLLHQVLDLQNAIANLTVKNYGPENRIISLEDICYAPLSPENNNCTILSVLNYFQNSHEMLDKIGKDSFFNASNYCDHILSCTASPTALVDATYLHTPCMGTYGGPVFPWTALAGYDGQNYKNATTLVITFPVVNYHPTDSRVELAKAWETVYLDFMKSYSNPNLTIAHQAERSVEDEISRESYADIGTIGVSYLVMFAYVSIALGQFFKPQRLVIDSKVLLGLSGVVIVFCSVAAAVGTLSLFQVPATLIVIEVVPFLVLAVGVDNIFILVQTLQRTQRLPYESTADRVSRALAEVGPSMLLTSSSESVAFYLGALSNMPAVKAFSLYAATAVLFNFLLQITCFVALLTLDTMRQEQNRYEILCCIPNKKAGDPPKGPGLLQQFMQNIYSPVLLSKFVRWLVVIVFSFAFCAAISFLPKLSIGLDQKLSMPKGSYMLDYFNWELKYLNVGPPVYFIVKGRYNYSSADNQNKICGTSGCNSDSLTSQIYEASHQSEYQHIAHPASSWIDDYFDWSKSGDIHTSCCRVYNGTSTFCPASIDNDTCISCRGHNTGRPSPEDFDKYLPFFLEDIPCVACAKGGKAAYGQAISFEEDNETISATYFMTYHTVCRNSSDYILAIDRARNISANITHMLQSTGDFEDVEVITYSIFYVFYEQYLTMYRDAIINLLICTSAIFVITFFLLGCDLFSAIISTGTITMITVDLMGIMYLWDIQLNAISIVNLVMSIGISVEFCSHITRAFAISIKPTKLDRAHDALAHIGCSVLSGITLTKALGIVILYFSKSQLFQVYYFRMYLSIVILGGSHGLIFLPVLLSYIGPGVNKARLLKYSKTEISDTTSERSPLLSDNSIQGDGGYNNSIHA